MYRPFLLPAGLLALLSTLAQAAEPTTPLDPFYNIEKLAQRPPEPPVCCLRPLPSSEPAEEILSFEEWKAKQEQALQQQRREEADGKKPRDVSSEANARTDSSSPRQQVQDLSHSVDDPSSLEAPAPPPAHFRVPLTDRFNYASLDCSARVHYSHHSARSSSSLLSSKKDKYMLSPCDTPGEDKFVVIELCEDIRIDTVQLANFEFFSGVFKDFSVSVARTNPADPEAWTPAGTYRAKNIRGIQSFHPPKTLRDFYRFIRIDFHSHYGNEYYCPISLLRVYGLTHLEQWKWEIWESEYQEKLANAATVPSIDATAQVEAEDAVTIVKERLDGSESLEVSVESPSWPSSSSSGSDTVDTALSPTKPKESLSSEATLTSSLSEIITSESPAFTNVPKSTGEPSFSVDSQSAVSPPESLTESSSDTSSHSSLPSSGESPTSSQPSSDLAGSDTVAPSCSSPSSQSSDSSSSDSIRNPDSTSSITGSSPQVTTVVPQETRPAPAASASGESIYRTIMTRLSALEQNSTLYLRYVEEQTRSLRDALTRLEEDVGRLEGLSKATTQSFQKIINEMDRQRRRLEREHGELQTRVDFLTDEVILEKRLGIAQLCLLLTVLVFMALTRGSRGEPFIAPASLERRGSFREWGRRHLSSFSSGEWATKLRAGSPTPIPGDFVKSSIPDKKSDKVKFPTRRKHDDGDETPQRSSTTLAAPMPTRGRSIAEIRTPHSRHVVTHRPRTPTSASFTVYTGQRLGHGGSNSATISQVATRPRIRRASSHTAPAPVVHSLSMREGIIAAPLSAKKWAKSAHLHEIRKANPKTRHDGASGNAVATSDVRFGQENVHSREADVAKSTVSRPPTDSATQNLEQKHDNLDERLEMYSRVPFSASHLQNLARMQDGTEIDRLCLGLSNGVPKIIDLDTESESWVDTDIEGSESGDRSP